MGVAVVGGCESAGGRFVFAGAGGAGHCDGSVVEWVKGGKWGCSRQLGLICRRIKSGRRMGGSVCEVGNS